MIDLVQNACFHSVVLALVIGMPSLAAEPRKPDLPPEEPMDQVQSPKRGVGYWTAGKDRKREMPAGAVDDLGSAWVYNWGPGPRSGEGGLKAEFVPMIWDENTASDEVINAVREAGYKTLLGFNEPDNRGQAEMTVEQAIELWPVLERSGLRLGSPGPAGHDEWLDSFMKEAKKRNYRVDFSCIHWYGDVTVPDAVEDLRNYCRRTWEKFGIPVWLTEYSGPNWKWHSREATMEDNARFARDSCLVLDSLPYVERYAWFICGDGAKEGRDYAPTSLHLTRRKMAPAGIAYRDAFLRPDHGLRYRFYRGSWKDLPDFSKLKPDAEGRVVGFDVRAEKIAEPHAVVFDGYIQVPRDGTYFFYLRDRESALHVGDELVVHHPAKGGATESDGSIALAAGRHRFQVAYRHAEGKRPRLRVSMAARHLKKGGIPLDALFLPGTLWPDQRPLREPPIEKASPSFSPIPK